MAMLFGTYSQHTDTVQCPRCGSGGAIVWEDVQRPDGREKELIRIVGNFYERLRNKPPYPIELVCDGCGMAQPSRLQAESTRSDKVT